ncbi:hypothetical protein OB2597_03709 [Pseudooceanicola batsensis HTCC2597]|uniref:PRC-barrel domain-containing protein n=1 Tax=Pseudooceanicola batsensis (strain ATCC BAA-863 / DSM 15984 / KCTC 12145 / HTCC2597) TaxID=252305 RepID=A3U3S5_PSEBH|nr:PRC-barrel domain-containing protein [Pseudooceanicola batsensis]EAQ01164.1 hypothetical protein OB2597_03709 [Pseudooceanicola batsensis HTCC2597]
MKHLLLTTAMIAAGAAGTAIAQEQNTASPFVSERTEGQIRASDFIGMRIYAAADAGETTEAEGARENWEDVGEVNDVIMDRDGQVQSVLVDIGGFLGIGERQVAVTLDEVQFVSDNSTEDGQDFFLVLNADPATLEEAPAYGMDNQSAGAGMNTGAEAERTEQTAEAGNMDENQSGDQMATADTGATSQTASQDSDMAANDAEDMAEDTGEDVAQATDSAEESIEDGAEEMAQAGENAGETMEEGAEDVAVATENAGESVEEGAEDMAQSAENAADEAGQELAEAGDAAEAEAEQMASEDAATDGQSDARLTATDTEMAGTEADQTAGTMDGDQTAGNMDGGFAGTADGTFPGTPVENTYLTADNLDGARVYDANDEWVGEISELIVTEEGEITDAIIDVGGFLGIGEKPVALKLSDLQILRQDGSDDVRIYTAMAEEELESMPEFQQD